MLLDGVIRLSAQPIQRYSGVWLSESFSKKSGSLFLMFRAHSLLPSRRCSSVLTGRYLNVSTGLSLVFRRQRTLQEVESRVAGTQNYRTLSIASHAASVPPSDRTIAAASAARSL